MRNKVLAIFTFSLIITLLLTIYFLPSVQNFGDSNPYWNGLSYLKSNFNAYSLSSYTLLPSVGSGYVLLIIGPQKQYYADEINKIENFLNSGGVVLIADNFGTGNNLLQSLGLGARFGNQTILDPIFNAGNNLIIYGFTNIQYIRNLTLYYATYLVVGQNYNVIVKSSIFSYLSNSTEQFGPFVLAAETKYGQGKIVLVSSPYVFVNYFFNGNLAFLNFIVQNRTVILDTAHWNTDLLTTFKNYEYTIYVFMSNPLVKYPVIFATIAIIFSYRARENVKKEDNEIQRIINENPDWDKLTLERIKEEREKYGS